MVLDGPKYKDCNRREGNEVLLYIRNPSTSSDLHPPTFEFWSGSLKFAP